MGTCFSTAEEQEVVRDVEEKIESKSDGTNVPVKELTKYHRAIEEKYKEMTEREKMTTKQAEALMSFTGWYAMDSSTGSYLHKPYHDVSFVICMDGKTATRYAFTGSFEGGRLKQKTAGGDIDLQFARPDLRTSNGVVATFKGSIFALEEPLEVQGSTYNCPTTYDTFIGKYYLKENKVLVMEIKPDYKISYDFGFGLQQVPTFAFNLNMWFFSFFQNLQLVFLIMGCGAGKGLACNDTTDYISSRSLYSIPDAPIPSNKPVSNNITKSLADLSGYYQLTIHEGAFLSIQGICKSINHEKCWTVKIGVSTDGITSKEYFFDTTMTFRNNTLKTPDLELTFDHGYNKANGTVCAVQGSFMGYKDVKGYNRFNPIPLSAFGGVPLVGIFGINKMMVSSDQITYNGTVIANFEYVPLMFIFAGLQENAECIVSFGSTAEKGITALYYGTYEMKNVTYLFALKN